MKHTSGRRDLFAEFISSQNSSQDNLTSSPVLPSPPQSSPVLPSPPQSSPVLLSPPQIPSKTFLTLPRLSGSFIVFISIIPPTSLENLFQDSLKLISSFTQSKESLSVIVLKRITMSPIYLPS